MGVVAIIVSPGLQYRNVLAFDRIQEKKNRQQHQRGCQQRNQLPQRCRAMATGDINHAGNQIGPANQAEDAPPLRGHARIIGAAIQTP